MLGWPSLLIVECQTLNIFLDSIYSFHPSINTHIFCLLLVYSDGWCVQKAKQSIDDVVGRLRWERSARKKRGDQHATHFLADVTSLIATFTLEIAIFFLKHFLHSERAHSRWGGRDAAVSLKPKTDLFCQLLTACCANVEIDVPINLEQRCSRLILSCHSLTCWRLISNSHQ